MSQIFISKNNTTTIPLGINQTYIGATDVLTSYEEVDLNLTGSPSNATGTLYFEFSPDGNNWDVSVPLVVNDLTNFPPIPLRTVLPFFRVKYINGPIAQTTLRLTVVLHKNSSTRLTRFLNQDINTNEPVEIIRVAKSILPEGAATEGTLLNIESIIATESTLSNINTKLNTLGQKTASGSAPVVLASDQAVLSNPLRIDPTGTTAQPITDNGGSITVDGTVAVSNFPATQTVTGTVTANQGTPNSIGNSWPVEISDGSNILGTNTHPVRIDPTGTTAQPITDNAGSITVDSTQLPSALVGGRIDSNTGSWLGSTAPSVGSKTSANSIPVVIASDQAAVTVSGTITANQGGTWTVQPGNTANTTPWLTTISQGGNSAAVSAANALKVDGSAVTQPISAASLPLPTGAATLSEQQTQTTSLQLIDNLPHGMNAAFNNAVAIGGQLDDSGTTAATENNIAPARITAQRGIHVNLRDNSGTEIGTTTTPVNVTPTPPTDRTSTGTITALNGTVSVSTVGCAHVGLYFSGTWVATILAEGTIDGSNWFSLSVFPIDSGVGTQSASISQGLDSIVNNGQWLVNCHGFASVRVRSSLFSSGTLTAFLRATEASGPPDVQPIIPADSGAVDAFSRFRISSPESLFVSKQINDKQPLFWDDQQTSGGGTSSTYQTNKASTNLNVTLNVAGVRVRQTFRRFNYQPGKSQNIQMTGVLVQEGGVGSAASNRRIGLFDQNNGVFFVMTGTTLGVAVRTFTSGSAVTTIVSQSNWNLDKLDGSGGQGNQSGVTIDVSKAQIFVMDFQWLGVGRIRFGFNINGRTIYCHQVLNSNINSLVYMSTPNLPLRFEIESLGTGAATTATVNHICASVESEGGYEDIGFNLSVDRGATVLTTANNTNIYALLAIQLQSGFLSATIIPTYLSVMSPTANVSYRYMLILNPQTIAGAALTYNAVANSAIQFAIPIAANLVTIGTGTTLFSAYEISNKTSATSNPIVGQLQIGSSIAGVSDTLVLAVQPVPNAAADYYASLSWREII